MKGRKVTGRFFIFLMILVVVIFLIVYQLLPSGPKEGLVVSGSTSQAYRVQAVILRDEPLTLVDGNSTVEYVAEECSTVKKGDEIAGVYSAAYSSKEMTRLESVRQDIRAYHSTILANIVDSQLDLLDTAVEQRALELKSLMNGSAAGSLINAERQLSQAMQARQEYLRQNRREDSKLNTLYEDEEKRKTSISSWRTTSTAATAGTVSFYLDGWESLLSVDNLSGITVSDVRRVLSGATPDASSRLTMPIYRIVSDGAWYVLAIVDESRFSATTGQEFRFQLEGFDDVIYTGSVSAKQTSGSDTLIVIEITDPIGPLIYQRSGWITIGTDMEGLYVPSGALIYENGQSGVMRIDNDGFATFVPVQVLSSDDNGVLVQSVVTGALLSGNRVLVY